MNLGAALSASFLAGLAHPGVWALTLASFLFRGGIVLLVAPIVVLPSPVGLANAVAPMLTSMVLGGFSPGLVTLFALIVAGTFTWLLLGGWVAALLEVGSIRRIVADDAVTGGPHGPAPEGRRPRRSTTAVLASHILAARLAAALPLTIALAAGSVRLVDLTYRELTLPSETGPALIVRVIRGAPDTLAWIAGTWLIAEVLGALAARRIVLHGDGAIGALARAMAHILRRPHAVLLHTVLPLAALLAVLVGTSLAANATWDAIRAELAAAAHPVSVAALVLLFVALWGGGLLLTGVVTAWRSASWTIEMAGTFGGVAAHRSGEWSMPTGSGTLGDLRPRGVEHDPR